MSVSSTARGLTDTSRSGFEELAGKGPGYVAALRAKEEEALLFAASEDTHKINTYMDSKLIANTKDILNNQLSVKA